MRNTNERLSGQGYRTTNSSKRLKVVAADSLSASRPRRSGKASRYNQIIKSLSPEKEEYDEDEPQEEIPEYDLTDSEPEQVEEQKRAFKSVASAVRPLLQLFSEDSRNRPEKQEPVAPTSKKTARQTIQQPQQTLYKNISISSDEEIEEPEESKDDDRSVFLNGQTIYPLHLETVPAKTSKRFNWTPKSTNVFLELWEKNIKDFRGKRKNSLIHVEMAHEMREFGVSHREIKSKIENMTKKQRTEAEKILNGDETLWPYYKRVKSLIMGPISTDFEEVIFDNTESSEFFKTDHSNACSELSDMKDLENLPNDSMTREVEEAEQLEEEEHGEEKKEPSSPVIQNTQKDKHRFESKAIAYSTDERLLQIEIEKLEVEKQKLQVMKHISRDLSSISKTLVELLRNIQK